MPKIYAAGDPLPAADYNAVVKTAGLYAASSAGSDTYTITVSPVPSTYAAGDVYNFKADVVNTGAATLNVNALGAKSIFRADGSALQNGDIEASSFNTVIYDGTNFRLLSRYMKITRLVSNSQSSVNDADNTSEQTAYSFTLPANELSTLNILHVRVIISACTYHASAAPGTIYLKYGATALQAFSIPSGSSGAVGYVDLYIIGNGATNSQTSRMVGEANNVLSVGSGTTAAIDSTADQTVSICTKWTGSGWGQNITLDGYVATILRV